MSFETAIFAGGCFWCMVEPFDTYPGIEKVESGYTGGHVKNSLYIIYFFNLYFII